MYPISFSFKSNGDYVFDKSSALTETLEVRNEFGVREKLKMVKAYEGWDTLGIALAPDGNMNDETKLLQKKIGQ